MHALARAAMLRHPAEPYLPFITSLRASYAGDDNPIPWVGATLERASVYGPAHLVLARAVARRSPSQARMEYRLAVEQLPALLGAAAAEAPRLVGGYYDAMELVPGGKEGVPVLEAVADAVRDRLPATCVRLDAELAERAPTRPGPAMRAASAAIDDLSAGEAAPWCEGPGRSGCVQDALDQSARARRLAPERCAPSAFHARARVASGDVAGGLSELQDASDTVTERVPCLQQLVSVAWAVGDEARARAALDKIASAGCSEDSECARDLRWAAGQEEEHAYPRKALALYKRAYERTPADEGLLEAIARLAAQTGLHVEAAEDYGRLARAHPADPRWPKAQQVERDEAMKGVLKP